MRPAYCGGCWRGPCQSWNLPSYLYLVGWVSIACRWQALWGLRVRPICLNTQACWLFLKERSGSWACSSSPHQLSASAVLTTPASPAGKTGTTVSSILPAPHCEDCWPGLWPHFRGRETETERGQSDMPFWQGSTAPTLVFLTVLVTLKLGV